MTEQTGSAVAGNPAANAAGNEGAGAGAGGPAAGAGAAANAPWYGAIEDSDLRGYAELKGFKDPATAIQSYRELERFQGVPADRLLKLPEAGDAAGLAEVHKKLGFAPPEKADDYGLSAIEGFDPGFVKGAEAVLLKHGVPKDMALAAMKDIGGILGEMENAANAGRQGAFDGELNSLKTEWGANFDGLVETGKRAAAEYMSKSGLGQGDMDAIRDAIGQAKFNKLWAGIGSTMGESAFIEGKTPAAVGSMTPEAATVKRNQLAGDGEWFKRFQAGDMRAVQEWKQVNDVLNAAAESSGVVR